MHNIALVYDSEQDGSIRFKILGGIARNKQKLGNDRKAQSFAA